MDKSIRAKLQEEAVLLAHRFWSSARLLNVESLRTLLMETREANLPKGTILWEILPWEEIFETEEKITLWNYYKWASFEIHSHLSDDGMFDQISNVIKDELSNEAEDSLHRAIMKLIHLRLFPHHDIKDTALVELVDPRSYAIHSSPMWTHGVTMYYESRNPATPKEDTEEYWWCPITKKYLAASEMTVFEIAPLDLGEFATRKLFGEFPLATATVRSRIHFMSPQDGLVIAEDMALLLKMSLVTIVPVEVDKGNEFPTMLRLVPVVPLERLSGLPEYQHCANILHEIPIHGIEMEFKNDKRPGLEYLYFNFIMTHLQLIRYLGPDYDYPSLHFASKEIWGSTNRPWIDEGIMNAVSKKMIWEPDLKNVFKGSNLALGRMQDNEEDHLHDVFSDLVMDVYFKRYSEAHSKYLKNDTHADVKVIEGGKYLVRSED